MEISMRSILTAGITAVTATAIVAAPSVHPLPSPEPNIALAAAVQTQPSLQSLLRSSAQPLALTPGSAAVTPTLASTPALVNLANGIVNTYNFAEPWVQYGFQVAASVVGWIPIAGWFGGQIMVFYTFGEGLVASTVLSGTSWLAGNGSFLENASGWVVNIGRAFIWLGLDEVAQFIPLPPFGFYPPRPPSAPLPTYSAFSALAALAAPTPLAGPIGNGIVNASQALADVSNAIWDVWNPIRDSISYGVDWASYGLSLISYIPLVPAVDFELNAGWNLIAREGNAITGFAHDMINAGNTFVNQAVNNGLITATNNAYWTTANSMANRGTEIIDAPIDFALDNLQYFTGIYIPHAAAASQLQRVSTDPPVAVPTALTDALRPLTEARDTLKTNLDAGAVKAAAAVDGLVGLSAANELVKKTRDTIAVSLTPTITQEAKANVTPESEGADIKAPGNKVRTALSDAVAGAKAQVEDNAKDASDFGSKIAKRVDKSVKKLVTGPQKAGENVEKTVTRKTEKKADKAPTA